MPVIETPTTQQDPAPTTGADPSAPAVPAGQGDPSQQNPSPPAPAPQRPEGLPDNFWDDATGIRTEQLVASYNELATEHAKLAETFKDFPDDAAKAGEFYKLPEQMLPEGIEVPANLQLEPDTALLERALPVLHKHRIAPDAFHDLARAFNAHELERYQSAAKEFGEDAKKLGANAETRRKAVADGIAAIVGPERAKFIDASAISSQAVEFFEAVVSKFTTQSNVVPLDSRRDDAPPKPAPTIEQRWYGGPEQKAG